MLGKKFVVDVAGVNLTSGGFNGKRACGIRDFLAGTVGEGEDEVDSGIVFGAGDSVFYLLTSFFRKHVMSANGVKADVLLEHLGQFITQKTFQQLHQGINLFFWPVPIF